MAFQRSERARIEKENPELSFGDLSRKVGTEWKALTETEKEKFYAIAKKDEKRYEEDMEKYRPADSSSSSKDSSETNPLFHRPMHLLKPSDDRTRLTLDSEAFAALAAVTGPVVLVSIVGTQRGGKSTLMNLLHSRRTTGFGLGHSYDGFWVWARRHPQDEELTVLLMDTEGLDTPHIPEWYNWVLASLALLASSYFIYQSKGSIDQSSCDRLSLILQVANQIKGEDQDSTDDPHFLWLIRDQQLAFKNPAKKELLKMLRKDQAEQLARFFDTFDCYPLKRPVNSDEQLALVDTMTWRDLREEFREEYVMLESKIFSSVNAERHIGGQLMTGTFLSDLLDKYVSVVTGKGILSSLSQLPTQKDLILQMATEKALQKAMKIYHESFISDPDRPVEFAELFSQHRAALDAASAVFFKEAGVNPKSSELEYGHSFREAHADFLSKIATWSNKIVVMGGQAHETKALTGGLYYDIFQQNLRLSERFVEKSFSSHFQTFTEKCDQLKFTSISEFEREASDLTHSFLDKFQGSEHLLSQASALSQTQFQKTSTLIHMHFLQHKMTELFERSLSSIASDFDTKLKAASVATQDALDIVKKDCVALSNQRRQEIETLSTDQISRIALLKDDLTAQIVNVASQITLQSTSLSSSIETTNEKLRVLSQTTSQRIESTHEIIESAKKVAHSNNESLSSQLSMTLTEKTQELKNSQADIQAKFDEKIKELADKLSHYQAESEKMVKIQTEDSARRFAQTISTSEESLKQNFSSQCLDIHELLAKAQKEMLDITLAATEFNQRTDKAFAAQNDREKEFNERVEILKSSFEAKSESIASNERDQKQTQQALHQLSEQLSTITKSIANTEEEIDKIHILETKIEDQHHLLQACSDGGSKTLERLEILAAQVKENLAGSEIRFASAWDREQLVSASVAQLGATVEALTTELKDAKQYLHTEASQDSAKTRQEFQALSSATATHIQATRDQMAQQSTDIEEMNQKLTQSQQQIQLLTQHKEHKESNQSLSSEPHPLDLMQNFDKLNRAQELQAEQMSNLTKELANLKPPTLPQNNEPLFQRSVEDLQQEIQSLSGSIRLLESKLSEVSEASQQGCNGLVRLQSAVTQTFSKVEKQFGTLTKNLDQLKLTTSQLVTFQDQIPEGPPPSYPGTHSPFSSMNPTELKIQDLQTKISSLQEYIQAVSDRAQGSAGVADLLAIEKVVDERMDDKMIAQRRELVDIVKKQIHEMDTAIQNLGRDLFQITQVQATNQKGLSEFKDRMEQTISTLVGRGTQQPSSATISRDQPPDSSFTKMQSEFQNFKHGLDAVWASIASISQKLTSIESILDQ